jgi:hypothetical protein
MQFPELVANLDLGLAADLFTDARPGGAKAKSTAPIYRLRDASQ